MIDPNSPLLKLDKMATEYAESRGFKYQPGGGPYDTAVNAYKAGAMEVLRDLAQGALTASLVGIGR